MIEFIHQVARDGRVKEKQRKTRKKNKKCDNKTIFGQEVHKAQGGSAPADIEANLGWHP